MISLFIDIKNGRSCPLLTDKCQDFLFIPLDLTVVFSSNLSRSPVSSSELEYICIKAPRGKSFIDRSSVFPFILSGAKRDFCASVQFENISIFASLWWKSKFIIENSSSIWFFRYFHFDTK